MFNNIKLGLPSGFLEGGLSILVDTQQSVGQFGNAEIERVLIDNFSGNLIEIIILDCFLLTYYLGLYAELI